MSRITMVRYTVKPEAAEENVRLSKAVFDEARWNQPPHIAYGLFRQGDEFVHLFVNLAEDSSDLLTEMGSFKAFSADIAERCVIPPEPSRLALDLVDSYGLPS